MLRSIDRILTTHAGSLVRPPALRPFLERMAADEACDEDAHRRCPRGAVADVVREQAHAGVDIVSDGEYGKSISWNHYVLERLGGLEHHPASSKHSVGETASLGWGAQLATRELWPHDDLVRETEDDECGGGMTP
jgi:methionine synthase II (cobalamin-independent)